MTTANQPIDTKSSEIVLSRAATSETAQRRTRSDCLAAIAQHWPEYLMEAFGLGIFMVSACAFALVLSHPDSPAVAWLPGATLRRFLMGLAMGGTVIAIVYSPWGKQSGAHLNPSITFIFFRLGKIARWDAFFYAVFQLVGGLVGVLLMSLLVGHLLADPAVNYVVTVPGMSGIAAALVTELAISFVQMTTILWVSNSRWARWTGVIAAVLVATNITLIGPLSGMSMNPARTLSSAVPAHIWHGIWIYFTAPPVAMMVAADCYLWLRGRSHVFCAKLHHQNHKRCIFCEYQKLKS